MEHIRLWPLMIMLILLGGTANTEAALDVSSQAGLSSRRPHRVMCVGSVFR